MTKQLEYLSAASILNEGLVSGDRQTLRLLSSAEQFVEICYARRHSVFGK